MELNQHLLLPVHCCRVLQVALRLVDDCVSSAVIAVLPLGACLWLRCPSPLLSNKKGSCYVGCGVTSRGTVSSGSDEPLSWTSAVTSAEGALGRTSLKHVLGGFSQISPVILMQALLLERQLKVRKVIY